MIDDKAIMADINDGFDGRLDQYTFMYAIKWFKKKSGMNQKNNRWKRSLS